jgi:hypothetical protein
VPKQRRSDFAAAVSCSDHVKKAEDVLVVFAARQQTDDVCLRAREERDGIIDACQRANTRTNGRQSR